jgi:membrane dipeptidase
VRWIDGLSGLDGLPPESQVDVAAFDALAASSLTSFSTSVAINPGPPGTASFTYEEAVEEIARWHGRFARYPERLVLTRRADDVLRAHREGKTAVMLNFQNGTHLNGDLRNLPFFHDLGVRQIQLTYNSLNDLGSGCTERGDAGLSHFGVEVVQAMNELGMLVDLSHCGPRTTLDAIEASKRPVAFTHTNCRALRDHPRCKTDAEIREVAARGGLVGMTTYGTFVGSSPPVTLDDFIQHVEHAVRVAGVEHVGIGSDTAVQYVTDYPKSEQEFLDSRKRPSNFRPVPDAKWNDGIESLNGPGKFRAIHEGLQRRGFAAADIDKILGGNFLRLYRDVLG